MKLVILAGGYGTRLGEISQILPKPMVEIGGKPIIWHIMKIYSYYGIKEFILCLGYKADLIKDYFLHYAAKQDDFTVDIGTGEVTYLTHNDEKDWKVTLVDTGVDTLKGGRLKRIEKYLTEDVNLLTYGDGVADIDINRLIDFHFTANKIVTLSGVHPPARFGELRTEGDILASFKEKAQTSQGLINGGFMVFNRELLNYLSEDETCDLEYGVFERLAEEGKIAVFKHEGLWACMDNERDIYYLNQMWKKNDAFWKVW